MFCKLHLGCFQFLAIMNEAAVNIHVTIFKNECVPMFSFKEVFGRGIPESHGQCMLNCLRNCQFIKVAIHCFTFLPVMSESSSCSTSSLIFNIVNLKNFSHLSREVVVSHYGVNCISFVTKDVEHLCIWFLAFCASPFVKFLFRYSAHFSWLIYLLFIEL